LNVNGTVTATTSRARIQTAVSGLTGIGTANLSGISGTPSSSTYLRGDGTWATASSGTTTGAGAANYIAMWTGTSSLSSSTIYQSGSSTGIGTTSSGYILDVENTDKTAYSGTGSGRLLTSTFVPKENETITITPTTNSYGQYVGHAVNLNDIGACATGGINGGMTGLDATINNTGTSSSVGYGERNNFTLGASVLLDSRSFSDLR
jgi:hypothetical protein